MENATEYSARYRQYIEQIEAEDTALRLRAQRADYWEREAKQWRMVARVMTAIGVGSVIIQIVTR